MRFIFKQSYDADINLFRHSGYVRNTALMAALALLIPFFILYGGGAPSTLSPLIEIMCFAIAGMGVMVVTGFTGQVSLGHGAFFALGAYMTTFVLRVTPDGLPWALAVFAASILLGLFGYALARPTLRMTSTALAIATLLFMILTQQGLIQWTFMGGADGFQPQKIGGKGSWFADSMAWLIDGPGPLPQVYDPETQRRDIHILLSSKGTSNYALYFVALAGLMLVIWIMRNLVRSNLGRSLIAIRDSEISARSMGVAVDHYKSLAFGISAAITGFGGALYSAKFSQFTPDDISFVQAIVFLLIPVIGGLGSIHGAIFGAIAYVGMREMLMPALSDGIEGWAAESSNAWLESLATFFAEKGNAMGDTTFALILILILAAEPLGLYARWRKTEAYFQTFPFYRAGTFKRQRSYSKTERLK